MSENFDWKKQVKLNNNWTDLALNRETRLDHDTDLGWDYYNSPLEEYDANFRDVLPPGIETLSDYIAQKYNDRKGELIGMELGGPGIKLFEELAPGYFKETVGTTLTIPPGYEDVGPHKILTADVFSKRLQNGDLPGFQNIEKWVELHGKPDILIERMVGPIKSNPNLNMTPLLLGILSRWYGLLNNGGTAFVQLPKMYAWREEIETFLGQHKDVFDYQLAEKNYPMNEAKQGEIDGVYIRFNKLPGAPESLDQLLKTTPQND